MPPHFYLRCLGIAELRSPSGGPVKFRTRKPLALLFYLAVEPRQPHRRDRLADLLWPKASVLEGRHSVATALSVLRGKLGHEAFEATRDLVRFTFAELDLDLDRLATGDVLGDEFTPALDVGGFLEDFEIADAPEFQLWRDQQRARRFPEIRDAFVRLMDRCRRTGDFRRIETLADRLFALDDLSEDAIRAKMEARAFDGDRLGALRLFEQWRHRLVEELGAQPSAMVDGMAIRLRRRGWEQTRAVPLPPVFTDRWKGRPFVGRTSQYRTLYEVWERTMRSQARHALILGDSGIGKSTLVERLVTAAGLEGAASTRVQCYELERDIPYTALGGLVRGLLDRPEIAGTPPEWLAELAAIAPDLKARFSGLPPVPDTQGETARIRLSEAMHQLVTTIAEEHPVILVVDDVHLADDVSVAVLHLLMRRTQSQRIMVVLTARPAELTRAPSAARLRENQRGLGLEILELPPLTPDESAEVVEGLAQAAEVTPNLTARRALVRAAAGVPMVIELLFRDWQTNGDRCLALSVGAMTADAVSASSETAYQQILDRVMGDLDDGARAVINLASVLGARLNDLPMYQLVDLSVAQTMAGMARLTELRLLRDGGRALDFRNEVIRAHAYFGVPSPLRTALHGRIADVLLENEGRGETVAGLEIAWHCIRAGRPEQSTPHLLTGAQEAMENGAPFEAEQALSSAMEWLQPRHHPHAMILLAEALQEQGRWEESRSLLAARFNATDDAVKEAAFVLAARARCVEGAHDSEILDLESALKDIVMNGVSLTSRARAAHAYCQLTHHTSGSSNSRDLYDSCASIPLSSLSVHEKTDLLLARTKLVYFGHMEDQYQETTEALELHRREQHRLGMANQAVALTENVLGCMSVSQGKYEQSVPYFLRTIQLGEKLGNERLVSRSAANLSMVMGRLGRYAEQARWAELGLSKDQRSTQDLYRFKLVYHDTWALTMLGETERAEALLSSEVSRWSEAVPRWIRCVRPLLFADVKFIAGRPREAAKDAAEVFRESDQDCFHEGYAGVSARWRAKLADVELDAEDCLGCLTRLTGRLHHFDVVDRAEILSSLLLVQRMLDKETRTTELRLKETLRALPDAVGAQMALLEFPT